MTNAHSVLLVGSGGREQALAYKIAESNACEVVYIAPGNAGSHFLPKLQNVDIAVDDFEKLANFAEQNAVAYTLVGPELPLVNGIVDYFQKRNLPIVGPNRVAAQLEGSKAFCNNFLDKYQIPTASSQCFANLAVAKDYLKTQAAPYVLKADGLAAGKGVIIANNLTEAETALEQLMHGEAAGEAGKKVVIESFLSGEEASFIVLISNGVVVPFATSQDHKCIDDGDKGANTGGMGAYSPAPIVDDALHTKIMQQIIEPTMLGLAKEGIDYCGFLYVGLMIDNQGNPSVVEFNCRFGDPEAQAVLVRLQTDLHQLLLQASQQQLQPQSLQWHAGSSVAVVLAAKGYPKSYAKGKVIFGLDQLQPNSVMFHSGTTQNKQHIVTNGGRVLVVTQVAPDLATAIEQCYQKVANIHFDDMVYRTDIGAKGLKRLKK